MEQSLETQFFLKNKNGIIYFLIGFLILSAVYIFFYLPPTDFPKGQVLTVDSGESLQAITSTLYSAHIIRSPFLFRTAVIILGGEKRVMAGDYLLDKAVGPVDLAYRLVNGEFHLPVARITIPEGWDVFQIADYLENTLINFNKTKFLALAKSQEGYLFPDTYFVSPTVKPEEVINKMKKTFDAKVLTIEALATSTRSFKDIIIIASILEDEARTTNNRRIIAGILWKRLSLGMPLQVDSTFLYINGKNTYDLTADDLKIDSPYNTYLYRGLPPGPIGNPGLDAINSALNPILSKYLYFLSSKSGVMYYAKTFEEHLNNKQLYLNK